MTEPSDLELEVLKAFWRGGAMSAREVQVLIEPELGWSASTTRTVLERMVAKGLLVRRSVHGLAVYEAHKAKVDVIGGVLNRLARPAGDRRPPARLGLRRQPDSLG
jgi:BlaI family penicillinase repressor